MSPNTAVSLIFVAVSLLILKFRTRSGERPYQTIALIPFAIAVFGLVGYIFGVREIYWLKPNFIPMAFNSTLVFSLLVPGILCAYPDRGIAGILTEDGPGGMLARRL